MAEIEVLEPAKTPRAAPPQVPEGWDPRESEQSLRAARSYNGYPWDQVISADQKSARQGWVYDIIYWTMEAFFAGVKATRTNIWNRMKVMTLEDIGPANPGLLPLVLYMSAFHRDDPREIARCAYLLAKSPKTRVNDWEAVYNSFPPLAGQSLCASPPAACCKQLAEEAGTPEEVRDQLAEALRLTQLLRAVRLIKLLRFHPGRLAGAPGGHAEYGILQAFRSVVGGGSEQGELRRSDYLGVCEDLALAPNWKWKSDAPESKTLLVYNHMATLWCSGKWGAAEASIPRTAAGKVDTAAYEARTAAMAAVVDPLVATHEEGGMELLGIPDIALDMHTARGKAMKRGFRFFMEVGSVLANEDPAWHNVSEWFRSRVVC